MTRTIINEEGPQGNLVIPLERVPVEAFQAIYYQLTRKTEELDKRYWQTIQVNVNAIQDLHHHFQQTVAQYNVQASDSEVVLSLGNGEVHKISSVEKFIAVNWQSITAASTSLTITYNFVVVLPTVLSDREPVAQRFSLIVEILKRPAPIRFGPVLFAASELDYRREPTHFGCRSRILYSDVAVGRTLQVVVDDWVNRSHFDDLNAYSPRAVRRLTNSDTYVVSSFVMIALLSGIFFEVPVYKDLITPMRYLLIVLGLVVVAIVGSVFIASKISDLAKLMDARSLLSITKGDDTAFAVLEKERKSARAALNIGLVVVGLGIVIGFAVNAASAWLLPKSGS